LEIVPGIHKIDRVSGVNCYLIVQESGLLVIDTGIPGNEDRIAGYVKRLGRSPRDIKYIILTHADIDHIGCAAELRDLTGARVAVHKADVPVLTGKQKFKTVNNFLSPLVGLAMDMLHFHPFEPDIVFEDGYRIDDWQIVSTPGHTPGSVCIYQPGQSIFVGDAMRTSSKSIPRPISLRICLDLEQVRRSLFTIASLDYRDLFPGHGAPMLGHASQEIQEYLARWQTSHRLFKKVRPNPPAK
jgi:glyoxylase-like metal-dependent hydrolase (beta-lactamase superfamily II)